MIKNKLSDDSVKFIQTLIKVRRLNKMLSTYYIRLEDQIYPDGCVRLSFHHCSTVTGRLSGDFQQTPSVKKAKVKEMFISRYI